MNFDHNAAALKRLQYSKKQSLFVYVAGPIHSTGHPGTNVKIAWAVASELVGYGFVPFVPHLYYFADILEHQPADHWMRLDLAWLSKCDVLLRLPGQSRGAAIEEQYCQTAGIPVWYLDDTGSVEEFVDYLGSRQLAFYNELEAATEQVLGRKTYDEPPVKDETKAILYTTTTGVIQVCKEKFPMFDWGSREEAFLRRLKAMCVRVELTLVGDEFSVSCIPLSGGKGGGPFKSSAPLPFLAIKDAFTMLLQTLDDADAVRCLHG